MHLLDSAEPDIQFVVQIEADVGQSEAESNISLNLYKRLNVRRGSVQQVFYYAEITEMMISKTEFVLDKYLAAHDKHFQVNYLPNMHA